MNPGKYGRLLTVNSLRPGQFLPPLLPRHSILSWGRLLMPIEGYWLKKILPSFLLSMLSEMASRVE